MTRATRIRQRNPFILLPEPIVVPVAPSYPAYKRPNQRKLRKRARWTR